MPGGNKTGPEGKGPMTGRRMGFCVSNEHPGSFYSDSSAGFGKIRGRGRGFGRGAGMGFQHRNGMGYRYGNSYCNDPSMENVSEKTLIENDIRILREQLSGLEERLGKLKED
ncbi:MAG: DUF5320 domain-containing protein [Bacteroidales bacterium]|nr:DUF5320 domain-containing protein [Bacteroidales bacterium]MCF8389540.1 DUF5320 domain-containing protein [Bacteroidales bacterium]